ncbi:hypothetical protein GYMLUDRAFT_938796 [Collybiopsis luxurians FD-317 M1]|uniref:Unplaced genomic scaffold GYMLUscaffold_82, whole genome shotgun sequence n=1 Tax=Collybiopsis luxurians FD-317 M1 TaxID=944289 RepID=A0A0D0BFE0_9AGAR|nr:hypothetical protein GYMLUDRAFT_938796 [Collybiopsis luxurians FD-317 M1]
MRYLHKAFSFLQNSVSAFKRHRTQEGSSESRKGFMISRSEALNPITVTAHVAILSGASNLGIHGSPTFNAAARDIHVINQYCCKILVTL